MFWIWIGKKKVLSSLNQFFFSNKINSFQKTFLASCPSAVISHWAPAPQFTGGDSHCTRCSQHCPLPAAAKALPGSDLCPHWGISTFLGCNFSTSSIFGSPTGAAPGETDQGKKTQSSSPGTFFPSCFLSSFLLSFLSPCVLAFEAPVLSL